MKISIIIPVYNCEDYIEQCLTSVQHQTCTDLEIICIDDGSTDNSVDVIRRLQGEDGRIQLFRQSNKGAGRARNLGIRRARGQYLAFLDADDYYLDERALEQMIALCDVHQVQACGSFRKNLEDGEEKKTRVFLEAEEHCAGKVLDYVDVQLDYHYQSFIFARELILDNRIFFPAHRRFEDPPFMVRALYTAKKFAVADTFLYCYRLPVMAARFDEVKAKDLAKGLRDNLRFASKHQLDKLFSRTLKRVEYDYESIMYRNFSSEDGELLALLMEINTLARKGLQDKKYVIRPLRRILNTIVRDGREYEEQLLWWLKSRKEVAVYGVGKYAQGFLRYLEQHGLKERIVNIVVFNTENNPKNLQGIPVISADDFREKEMPLLVAAGAVFLKGIEDGLQAKGIEKYEVLDEVFLSGL